MKFLLTSKLKKIISVNDIQFTKFTTDIPCRKFVLYIMYVCYILDLLFAIDQEYVELNTKCTSPRQLNKMTSELEVCYFMHVCYIYSYIFNTSCMCVIYIATYLTLYACVLYILLHI